LMWVEVLGRGLPVGSALPAWFAPVIGLATQLLFTAGEALVAVAAWRAQGATVAWRVIAPRLIVAAAAETLAVSIASGRAELPAPIAVALAGPRAAGAAPASGLAFAFASAGALAMVRVLTSAHLQARAAHVPFARGLATVLVLWLIPRLVLWWGFDLMQGRSFQP